MLIEGFLILIVVAIGSSFLLMALALLKGVAVHLWERWGAFFEALESRNWATTMGKVERAVITYTHSGRGGRVYTPVVRYSYGADGETFVSERFAFYVGTGVGNDGLTGVEAVVQRFRTGSSVEVHFDPKKPKRATLDRTVPPVVGPTLGWLLVLLLGGGLFAYLGIIIVRGPFEDPPNLGEVPPLIAQVGGFAVGIGVLFVLVAGVRAIRWEERRQRRLLRYLQSARPALVHEVSAGELVAVAGRAEELELEPEDDETSSSESIVLPFENGPLLHYDVDAESFRSTAFSDFDLRDATGVALVELRETESTFIPNRRLPIDGAVERFLDEHREDFASPISAIPMQVSFRCIKKDEPILVVGRAERDDEDEFVFRAKEGEPTSLLVATGTREEVVERLGKKIRRTRALFLLGVALIIAGVAAMLA